MVYWPVKPSRAAETFNSTSSFVRNCNEPRDQLERTWSRYFGRGQGGQFPVVSSWGSKHCTTLVTGVHNIHTHTHTLPHTELLLRNKTTLFERKCCVWDIRVRVFWPTFYSDREIYTGTVSLIVLLPLDVPRVHVSVHREGWCLVNMWQRWGRQLGVWWSLGVLFVN